MDTLKKDTIQALEENCGVITHACGSINLARSTFYLWVKTDPEFKAAVEEITEFCIDLVEYELFKKIKDGDTTAIIFYLKTKAKKRGYVERTEVTGKDGEGLNVIMIPAEGCKPIQIGNGNGVHSN